MKLGHIELFVKDTIKAKDFYVEILGFEIEAIQGDQFVWLKRDNQEVLLKPRRTAEVPSAYQAASCGIVFYTDNLEKTVEELTKKGLEFKGNDGSNTCLTFSDQDGNWFQLVSPNHE